MSNVEATKLKDAEEEKKEPRQKEPAVPRVVDTDGNEEIQPRRVARGDHWPTQEQNDAVYIYQVFPAKLKEKKDLLDPVPGRKDFERFFVKMTKFFDSLSYKYEEWEFETNCDKKLTMEHNQFIQDIENHFGYPHLAQSASPLMYKACISNMVVLCNYHSVTNIDLDIFVLTKYIAVVNGLFKPKILLWSPCWTVAKAEVPAWKDEWGALEVEHHGDTRFVIVFILESKPEPSHTMTDIFDPFATFIEVEAKRRAMLKVIRKQ